MPDIRLENLVPVVAQRIGPFLEDILNRYPENIHSIHITGSSVTEDYDERTSDINSIMVLKSMDLKFIELIAPLGKKYGKKGIAAPLIMTPDYIKSSLDVFPVEFHDFKLIHETVFGPDILQDVEIDMADLRYQCERDIKSKLIGIRQGYISTQGNKHLLIERFASSITGLMPLFRGITRLMGKEPPVRRDEVIRVLSESTSVNTDIYGKILDMKRGRFKPTTDELTNFFEQYYITTERIGKVIDELQV